MKRNRYDQVSFRQKLAACSCHPVGKGRRPLGPIRMLETQDQTAALVAIAHHGSRTIELGRFCTARPAYRIRMCFELERDAAQNTIWRRYEIHRLPTRGAKAAIPLNDFIAIEAAGRQDSVYETCPDESPHTAINGTALRIGISARTGRGCDRKLIPNAPRCAVSVEGIDAHLQAILANRH